MLTRERAEEIKQTGSGVVVIRTGEVCWIIGYADDGETVAAHVIGLNVDRWEDLLDLVEA